MLDILLDHEGDIAISDTGDINLTESKRQAALVRLRWISNEWRLGPDFGFPWFEEVFVKNPNLPKIQTAIRDEIMKVDGIEDAEVTDATLSVANRKAVFKFKIAVDQETFVEEVEIYG